MIGAVRSPGPYAIREDTTVQQLLSLAGGSTDVAALNGIRIVRTVDDEQVEVDAQLSDRVQPDDMLVTRAEAAYVIGAVRSPGR